MSDLKISMKPVHKKSLYLKISDAIYSYIQMNDLQPGDKLPSEREMSAMLQTSRNSVREGLRILEDRGLIEVKTGRGVFIKSPYSGNSKISLCLQNCSLEDIHELQSTLDHQAVLDAIERASDSEKENMIQIATQMVSLAGENIYSHILDHSFHSQLYKSAKSPAIEQLIIAIREERFVYQEDTGINGDSIWLKTIPEHLALAEAIRDKDPKRAIHYIDKINNYGFELSSEALSSAESPEVPKDTFRDCKQSPKSRASTDFGSSQMQKNRPQE